MRRPLLIAIFAAAVVAVPAMADETKPAAPAPTAAAPADGLICRRVEETGSLVKKKKKICHTAAEWDRMAANSRDAMGQGQMSGSASGQ